MDVTPLIALIKEGGGLGIAAVFFVLYWMERHDNRKMMQTLASKMDKVAHVLEILSDRNTRDRKG